MALLTCYALACSPDKEAIEPSSDAGVAGALPEDASDLLPESNEYTIIPDQPEEEVRPVCHTDVATRAEPAPVNLLLVLDRSKLMLDPELGKPWFYVGPALYDLVRSPDAAGLRLGLVFFPYLEDEGAADDVLSYAAPVVPVGALTVEGAPFDRQETELVRAISGVSVASSGGAPGVTAMRGAMGYALALAEARPDERVVVVFATSGFLFDPTSVPDPRVILDELVSIAGAAARHEHPVYTYVYGFGSTSIPTLRELEDVAEQGKGKAIFPQYARENEAELTQDFLDSMEELAYQSFSCEYPIELPKGKEVDFNEVNVRFAPDGTSWELLAKVDDPEDCGFNTWYFDNPDDPHRILLCGADDLFPDPSSPCAVAQRKTDPEVKIEFGCPSVDPDDIVLH